MDEGGGGGGGGGDEAGEDDNQEKGGGLGGLIGRLQTMKEEHAALLHQNADTSKMAAEVRPPAQGSVETGPLETSPTPRRGAQP